MINLESILNGNKEYKSVIADIRTHVCQVFEENELDFPGGFIAINSNHQNRESLLMNIFPLKVSIVEENVPQKYLDKCLSILNKERAYNTYLHYKNLHNYNKLTSLDHHYIDIDSTEAVFFSKEYYNISTKTTWEELLQCLSGNKLEEGLNLFDLICFHPGSSNFLAIPLPILTTPTVIIVIENVIPKEKLSLILRTLFFRTKESIHFFVYSRLISNLKEIVNSKQDLISNEYELVKAFCDELNKVILPCSYSIDNECFNYISDWPSKFNSGILIDSELSLKLNKFKVRFDLTSFHFPSDNHSNETQWIHKTNSYLTGKTQVSLMLENIYSLIYEQYKKIAETRSYARKSAVAAIMSRNMSHNIGSHVLPGFEGVLNRNKFWKDLSGKLGLPANTLFSKEAKKGLSPKDLDEVTFLESEYKADRELSAINKHIQERMEFIADVTMSEIFMFNNLPVISVLDDFKQKKEYLKHLCGGAEVKIYFKNNVIEITDHDLYASFPNDLMGIHAFYIILENIIRNTVKHSKLKKFSSVDKFRLTVLVGNGEESGDYYLIDIYDNLGVLNKENRTENSYQLIKDIQQKLDSDIIDENTNNIRTGAWGLLEMKFAAAFLINKLNGDLNASIGRNQLLEVGLYDNKGNRENTGLNLGYRFRIEKPRLAKIYSSDYKSISSNRLNELKSFGLEVIYDNATGIDDKCVSNHQFIITDFYAKPIYLNQRILHTFDKLIFSELLNSGTKPDIELFIWKSWIEQCFHNTYSIEYDNLKINEGQSNRKALFDNHGKQFKEQWGQFLEDQEIEYYESYGSESYTNKALDSLKESYSTRYFEFQEAIQTQVTIIDERVQRSMKEFDNNIGKVRKMDLMRLMGVDMPDLKGEKAPDNVINLEKFIHNPDDSKVKLERYIISKIQDNETRFIVIHMTIFEILCSNKDCNGIQEKLHYFKKQIQGDKEKSIILTSGRGTPSNLPDKCYFLHFSILQNYVIFNRSKFSLVKALYSVRRR